ncbi:MAG: FAD-dependent oxidoreductase [Bacteroidota bacterium]
MNNRKKIIVIGAGPAGLTAASKLAEGGCDVTVYEAGVTVGGLARSFELWGQTVDCGPHRFFSTDKIVNDFFKEVVGDDFILVNRLTRIYYRKKFYFYPLKAMNVLFNIGPFGVIASMWSYFLQRLNPIKNPKTFEDWVISRFGKKLFNIFFKNYSEKLWGIPCSRIDADWAAQRIKKFSLLEAVKSAIFPDSGGKHKTLVEQFAYPRHGTGLIYQKTKTKIENAGGKVLLNSSVQNVLVENEVAKGVVLKNGETIFADEVISTMPLTLMVKGLNAVPENVKQACDQLFFRNTILVYLEVDAIDLFPDQWIYVHNPDVIHGRITNFRNWSPELFGDKKTSILCMEYWCFSEDEIWKRDENSTGPGGYFQQLGETELRKTGLIKAQHKILNCHIEKLNRCYPVYETGYAANVETIKKFLDEIKNLRVIGRYGAFKYNNQDHSILMGLLAAKEILNGTNEKLWDINTDSEFQEP